MLPDTLSAIHQVTRAPAAHSERQEVMRREETKQLLVQHIEWKELNDAYRAYLLPFYTHIVVLVTVVARALSRCLAATKKQRLRCHDSLYMVRINKTVFIVTVKVHYILHNTFTGM